MNKEKDPTIRKQLADKIKMLVQEVNERLFTLRRCAATQLIFGGFDDKAQQLKAHTFGLFQNGTKTPDIIRDISKALPNGQDALDQYQADLNPSQKDSDTSAAKDISSDQGALEKDKKGLNTSEIKNSTETVTA